MASTRKLNPKDPASPWVCEYTDAQGKRRRITPKTGLKKDAEAARRKIEAELERGEHVADSASMTVRAVCDLYLKQCEDRVRRGDVGRVWYRNIQGVINGKILPKLGALHMNALTFRIVEDWHRGLMGGVQPVTAKGMLCNLKQIEAYALKRGYTKKAVVREVSEDVGGVKKRQIKTFTLDDVRLLLDLVDTREKGAVVRGHLFMKCAVQLAAFCGLRFGEIVGLTVESIDFTNRVLKIRHSLTILDEHKGPKTKAGNRDVPLPDRVAESLRQWGQDWYVPNDRRLVFRMRDGFEITRGNFHLNYWRPLLRRAGLEFKDDRFHFHALRHFAASLMIELGLPLTDVASLLGHEKFDMTLQVYAHPIVGGNRRMEAFDRISAALAQPRGCDIDATSASKALIFNG